jgi:sporulation protein YlmC with PRC-barrel domain
MTPKFSTKTGGQLNMRALRASSVVAATALLMVATPGHTQSKQPAESNPTGVQSKSTTTQSAAKGIHRVESKEQLVQWQGSQLIGAKVEDGNGKSLGKIEDVMVDSSGRIPYAVLSFGGFLGVGDKWFAIPWNAIQIERDRDGHGVNRIVLDVTKETLERAPSFTRDKWPDTRDSQWGRDTQKFWSDTSITMAVKSQLAKQKLGTLTKIDVDTHQGVVELKGTVDNDTMRQRAIEVARQVDGVKRVVNNLKVQGS